MTFVDAFKKVYFEDIFTIKGRTSRKEFWGADLIFLPSFFVIVFISVFISDGLADLVVIIGQLWAFVANFTASIRRAHDVGQSGWFTLIPLYNLILYLTPSEQVSNKWGDPRPHTLVNKNNIIDTEEGENFDNI